MKTLPFKYKNISPEDKYLLQAKNPPKVIVKFHDNIKNLQRILIVSQMKEINGEILKYFLLKIIL